MLGKRVAELRATFHSWNPKARPQQHLRHLLEPMFGAEARAQEPLQVALRQIREKSTSKWGTGTGFGAGAAAETVADKAQKSSDSGSSGSSSGDDEEERQEQALNRDNEPDECAHEDQQPQSQSQSQSQLYAGKGEPHGAELCRQAHAGEPCSDPQCRRERVEASSAGAAAGARGGAAAAAGWGSWMRGRSVQQPAQQQQPLGEVCVECCAGCVKRRATEQPQQQLPSKL